MSNESDPLYILGYQKGFASAAIKGQQAERERIIALLQDQRECAAIYGVQTVCDVLGNLIALIKGENE